MKVCRDKEKETITIVSKNQRSRWSEAYGVFLSRCLQRGCLWNLLPYAFDPSPIFLTIIIYVGLLFQTAPNLGSLTSSRMTHQAVISNGVTSFERCFPPSAGDLTTACTATLASSASTSALHSHGLSGAPTPYDEYEKLAQTLADTNWNEM